LLAVGCSIARIHTSPNKFTFETDPKNCDYRITVGARRKNESFDATENGTIEIPDDREKALRAEDPMYRLEHGAADEARAERKRPQMMQLLRLKAATTHDDYGANAQLRKHFRSEKTELRRAEASDRALRDKASLPADMALVPEHAADVLHAQEVLYGQGDATAATVLAQRERTVHDQSIFGAAGGGRTVATSHLRGPARQLLARLRQPSPAWPAGTSTPAGRRHPAAAVAAAMSSTQAGGAARPREAGQAALVGPAGGLVADYATSDSE